MNSKRPTKLSTVAAALLLAGVILPPAAHAANTCNAFISLNYSSTQNFHDVGDALMVTLTIGAGSIRGGTKATINRVRFELDCDAGSPLGLGCADDGAIIQYLGDQTISTDCPQAFSTGHGANTLPNQIVFTPAVPFDILANNPSFCNITFGVRVMALSDDLSPGTAEEVTGYSAANADVRCDNNLSSAGSQSGSIILCPDCNDNNACTTDVCDRDTGVCSNTPGASCDDNNACTTDRCVPATGLCENLDTKTPTCNDNNACTTDRCVPATGQCENLDTKTPTCNDNNACTTDRCVPATGQCENRDNVTATCNDNNACTTDRCVPATGQCENRDNVTATCNDNNACTTDRCVPATGQCENRDNVTATCNDNNACTTDRCVPATGQCENRDNVTATCNDNNACTTDRCVPATGQCENRDNVTATCNDNNACTTDRCVPATGLCENRDNVTATCNDNNACTTDRCVPATGLCENLDTKTRTCDDNNACTMDRCVPATGQCENRDNVTATCNDNNACTTDRCVPATGQCENRDNVTATCNDNNACTTDRCVPATGQCENLDTKTPTCNDNEVCTDDTCNPATGACVNTPDPTNDPSCALCELQVEKHCCIPPPPSAAFTCSKPLDSLSMVWAGTGALNVPIRVKAYKGGTSTALVADVDNIAVGEEVTITGFAGAPNDIIWEIFAAGTSTKLGQSTFHLSCSDADMDGSEDCGKTEGDGKGLSGFINQWVFEGMAGNGQAFQCTPDPGVSACVTAAPGPYECTKPIDELSMRWNGTAPIRVKAYKGGTGTALVADVDNIVVGEEVTITGFTGAPNDIIWEIFAAGTSTKLGESTFHVSCSDSDMNGSEDCGKTEGDGKGLSGFLNQWVFDGMAGAGQRLDCTPEPAEPTSSCELTTPAPPHCTTKVQGLGLRYVGGACTVSNAQGGKAKCTGADAGTSAPVRIRVRDSKSKTYLDTGASPSVALGAVVQATAANAGAKEFSSDSVIEIRNASGLLQTIKLHTSCSQPLNLGDRFGAVEVVSLDLKDKGVVALGGMVEYQYVLTNPNAAAVTIQSVFDNRLGELAPSGGLPLGPGETATLFETTRISENTVNTVDVRGLRGTVQCRATAMATVKIVRPAVPPLPFECSDAKPIDALTMTWNGTTPIRVKAYKGSRTAALVADVDNIDVGEEITITGFAGSPNDIIWEIFRAGTSTKLGESTFHVSCSDDDMDGSEDCGKTLGDGKGLSGFLNQWVFGGMAGNGRSLDCTP